MLTNVAADRLRFKDETGFEFVAEADKGNMFQFLPINKAAYNIGADQVVLCNRRPQRQWKRGLCFDNTLLIDLATDKHLYPDFAMIAQIFTNEVKSRVPEFIEGKCQNLTFDGVFSLVGKKFMLYEKRIGTYKEGVVSLENTMFEQEVNDLVRKNYLPFIVEVKK